MLPKNKFPYIIRCKNTFALLALTLVVLSGGSCKKDDPVIRPSHERYYPLEKGMWREYLVDSTVFRGSTFYPNDSMQFAVREEIDSTFIDKTGALNYIIRTYSRENENGNWNLRYVSAAKVNEMRAELLYNNDRYVKLIFPVVSGQGWNANIYNDEDPENERKSKYLTAHQPATINGRSFDSTLTVEVQNHTDAIFYEFETEQYAAGVGLIQHIWEELETQPDPDDKTKFVRRGHLYKKILTAYGRK